MKDLQKVPYGVSLEEHYGMKVDNGPKLNRNPVADETSTAAPPVVNVDDDGDVE
jgi:hypothetical protein